MREMNACGTPSVVAQVGDRAGAVAREVDVADRRHVGVRAVDRRGREPRPRARRRPARAAKAAVSRTIRRRGKAAPGRGAPPGSNRRDGAESSRRNLRRGQDAFLARLLAERRRPRARGAPRPSPAPRPSRPRRARSRRAGLEQAARRGQPEAGPAQQHVADGARLLAPAPRRRPRPAGRGGRATIGSAAPAAAREHVVGEVPVAAGELLARRRRGGDEVLRRDRHARAGSRA